MSSYKEITLQITKGCTLSCPYCFAGNNRLYNRDNSYISMEYIDKFLLFCRKNNVSVIRVTGGEPFLHPDIDVIINKFSEFPINIFTNLTIKNCVRKISDNQNGIGFLVNINDEIYYNGEQWNNVINNLMEIKSRNMTCVLGYNVFNSEFDLSYILELIKKLNHKRFRISIANPVISGHNHFLPYKEIRDVCKKIIGIYERLKSESVECTIDCPIAPCLIDKDDYEYILNP